MVSVVRAFVSVGMLVGFYVVALLQFLAAVALTIWLSTLVGGLIMAKLMLPVFVATMGATFVSLWKAVRAKPEPPQGLPVSPQDAPELWATVHELAGVVRTRVPDEIRLLPEVNAAVVEDSRLLGLVGGRRHLYIGLPLVQALRVDQLRSILAHELGHYSRRHTRLGAVAYRGRLAIGGALGRIGPYNVAGWIFKGYGNLYVLADNVVVRRQELEADQASVRVAGRHAAASALREIPVLDAAWDFFFNNYVGAGWEQGYAPDDLFGGFAELVKAREPELNELRAAEPKGEASKWDTHPPIARRIAAILSAPEAPRHGDARPAAVLVPDLIGAGRAMQQLMVDVGDRTVLAWPEFTAAMMTAQMQREADRMFRTIGRTVGATEVELGTVFDLIEAGRLADIAEPFFPNATRREAGPLFAEPLESLLTLAAVRSGVLHWRHSWSGPAELTDATGGRPPLDEIAALAVAPDRPEGPGEARRRLSHLGIDIARAVQVEGTASAIGARAIGAIANVKVDDVPHDLLVLTSGFVFVADPGKSGDGKTRLQALVGSAPVTELAQRHRYLPYEEVSTAKVIKRVPARITVTLHNGTELHVHETGPSELLTKKSRDALLEVAARLAQD